MTAIDPRYRAPIPTDAATPAIFTPLSLDPQRRFAKEEPLLQRAVEAAEGPERLQAAVKELEDRRAAAMAEAKMLPPPPEFLIRVPTSQEREQLNSRLVQMGITHVTTEQVRASMIEALYEIDWHAEDPPSEPIAADQVANWNEGRADEMAGFLDGVWQREDIQVRAYEDWRAQETERVLDSMAGAPERPETPMPIRVISVRDEAKARLLADRLLETPRLRKLIAKKVDFGRRNAVLIARLNLIGVRSPVLSAFAPDPLTGAIDEDVITAMRTEMEKVYGGRLADTAWNEIVAHIDQLYRLDEFEAGNFDSPPAKPSDQTGSTEASGDTGTSGGSLTGYDITAAPADGSETITDRSSGITTEPEASTTTPSPMDAA